MFKLHKLVPLTFDFWLGLAHGEHTQEIGGQEESEAEVLIFMSPSKGSHKQWALSLDQGCTPCQVALSVCSMSLSPFAPSHLGW